MKNFKQLLPRVAPKAFAKRGFSEARLLLQWSEIAGQHTASYCTPIKLSSGAQGKMLHLAVLPAFVLECQQSEPVLLERISTFFGYRAVGSLHLHHCYTLPQRVVRSAQAIAQQHLIAAQPLTAAVNEEQLRQALTRLGARIIAAQHAEKVTANADSPIVSS